jgi:hypothetical protein
VEWLSVGALGWSDGDAEAWWIGAAVTERHENRRRGDDTTVIWGALGLDQLDGKCFYTSITGQF